MTRHITYQDNDPFKNFLLNVKNGKHSLQEIEECVNDMLEEIADEYATKYHNAKPNQETQDKIVDIVKQIVKNELLEN